METHLQILGKRLSWRIFSMMSTMVVVWVYSGHFADAFIVGMADSVVKTFLYLGHDRVWDLFR